MHNKFILELTHDNYLFEQTWPDIFDQIEKNDVVLNDLIEYFLSDPIDQIVIDVKFILIEKVLQQLDEIDIKDLTCGFIRILNSPRNDLWQLHFLETLYRTFQLGDRLTEQQQQPIQTDLIKDILRNLQSKSLIFQTNEENEKWTRFLIEYLFSNFLNVYLQMKDYFQEFYQNILPLTSQSLVWTQIARVLKESIPDLLPNEESSVQIEPLVSQTINPNISSDELEKLIRQIIVSCPSIENRELMCSEIDHNLISKLADISIYKNLSILFFDLAVSILKFHIINAPNLCYELIRKENFYTWKDLTNQMIDLIQTCISYDDLIDDSFFGELTRLTDIIEILKSKLVITDEIQSIIFNAIFCWTDMNKQKSYFVYRMGRSLLDLIESKDINEQICLKFIQSLQNRIDSNNKEMKMRTKEFFSDIANYLANQIEHLKNFSIDIHKQLAHLFLSLLDKSFFDETQNMTCEHIIFIHCLYRTASTISHDDHARLYEPFLNQMYLLGKTEDKQINFHEFWAIFWSMIAFKIPNISKNHIEQFFDYTFQTKSMILISTLQFLSCQYIELFSPYLDQIIDIIFINNGQYLSSFIQTFTNLMRYQPKRITSKQIEKIFSSIDKLSFNCFLAQLIGSLSCVASCQPDLFDKYRKDIIDLSLKNSNRLVFECFQKSTIALLILHENSNQINETLTFLINLLMNQTYSDELQKQIVYICLLIAVKYKSFVVQRRDDFVKLNLNLIVNFIDENTTSKLDQSIIQQAEIEIESIEKQLNKDLLDAQIIFLVDSNEQILVRQLIDQLKQSGYICQIAQKLELSMTKAKIIICFDAQSKLNTNKPVIYLHIDSLQNNFEMIFNQLLVEIRYYIVPNLDLITEKYQSISFDNISSVIFHPQIVLSYQYNKRPIVLKIYQQLTQLGYKIWLDLFQMDGTETLIEKSKKAIIKSSCLIACITPEYIENHYCQQQLSLAKQLNKPIITLSLDNLNLWSSNDSIISDLTEKLIPIFDNQRTKRASSAPHIPQSRACTLM